MMFGHHTKNSEGFSARWGQSYLYVTELSLTLKEITLWMGQVRGGLCKHQGEGNPFIQCDLVSWCWITLLDADIGQFILGMLIVQFGKTFPGNS